METLFTHSFVWIILLITVIGEFLLPEVLKLFYPDYKSKLMVMSILGNPNSPVRKIYNIWLIWLGLFLSYVALRFFINFKTLSTPLAFITMLSILVFAFGAGLLSGCFSVNENKSMDTIGAKIHGFGAALGFMSLLFFPLLSSLIEFKLHHFVLGSIFIIDFIIAIVFFILFIMADKEQFKNTIISYEGLWQRLSLIAMYFPFVFYAIKISII